jgi:hypothetical protein
MRYESRIRSVVLIRRRKEGVIEPWGNGVFVVCEERLYLVTCRHLVRSDLPVKHGRFDLSEKLFLRLKLQATGDYEDHEVETLSPRRWRTTATLKDVADIVVVELPSDIQLRFDVIGFEAAELQTEPPNIGTNIRILELHSGVNQAITYNDIDASTGSLEDESQALINNASAPISFGHSGSLVYRVIDNNGLKREAIDQKYIQAVGIVVGARKFGGMRPEMVLFTRVLPILRVWEDYLEENGVEIKKNEIS